MCWELRLKKNAFQNLVEQYEAAKKTNPVVQKFDEDVRRAAEDYYVPFCVRSGPVEPRDEENTQSSMYAQLVLHITGMEMSGETELRGRDASVEAPHVDVGLQGMSRLKDALILSCVSNPAGVGFEVVPWPSIKSLMTSQEQDDLKKMSCVVPSDMMPFKIPFLTVDEKGRERVFFDASIRGNGHPSVRSLFSAVDTMWPHAIRVGLSPGDLVFMHNFSGGHSRESGTNKGDIRYTETDYLNRRVVRFDAVDKNIEGVHVLF